MDEGDAVDEPPLQLLRKGPPRGLPEGSPRRGRAAWLADVLDWVRAGGTVQSFAEKVPHAPDERALRAWLLAIPEVYAEARRAGCDALLDQMLAIADMPAFELQADDEGHVRSVETTRHRQLRIKTRETLVQMLDPTRYGPTARVAVQHGGAIGLEVVTGVPLPLERALAPAPAPPPPTTEALLERDGSGDGGGDGTGHDPEAVL